MKIFSESFTLTEVDPDGKVFDEVSRGVFMHDKCSVLLDYHSGLFMGKKTDRVEISLFSDENNFSEKDIPEKYTYLMGNGLVYKKTVQNSRQVLDISFSGLLARLEAPVGRIKDIQANRRLYLGIDRTANV
ncbi:DNA-directed RNA polymerases I, II, and III subunit RPABC3 [Nematocida major]|uniref:DNA-directed RNA polymerases I, II, and III subunit RPABC3 n=1 Tax=Nematocida major TaxID=1912982 RepID=UPI002008CE6C|nr:DNA-directed RNA polymerases I, II, and III subunit RPABC3 [Nematocida major]KAH9386875.1 DNA-directed RNA polymerases I, II, and III subunit RPABC3 [Nematocida major]